MWTEVHSSALSAVFTKLNSNDIEWMVLRNYEGLPEHNRAKDIDLVFDKRNFPLAKKVIMLSMEEAGFTHYIETIFQYVWCLNFISTKEHQPYSLKIDLLDGFVWRGAQVISFADLFKRCIKYKEILVPDPAYDAFMLWIKPLMTGGVIKEKYRSDIMHALESSPQEFRSLVLSSFGAKMTALIWPLLEIRNIDATIKFKKSLCHAAWVKALRRSSVETLRAAVDHFHKEIFRRSFRPKASMLSVAGPDGAGKSTFIDILQDKMGECLIREPEDIRVLHFRPNIFPNLKKLLAGKTYDESSEEFTSPHRVAPAGLCSSLLRLVYYWSDYVFGYWFMIRKQCIAGKIFIFDRYFYDVVVDPYRSRIKLPNWVRSLFLMLTPKPDMVFLLDGDAKTIYQRKQELPLQEIDRQIQEYRTLATRNRRFVVLDAKKSPYELVNNALLLLIEKCFLKLKK